MARRASIVSLIQHTAENVMSVDLSLFEQQGCKVDTGYDLHVLQQIFDDQHSHNGSAPGSFGGALPAPPTQAKLNKQAAYFYCYYMCVP